MSHTVISVKTATVQFCVYLESERVDSGHELNDYNAALASLTVKLGTWFIHFTGGGVINRRFMDTLGNRLIVHCWELYFGHPSVSHTCFMNSV